MHTARHSGIGKHSEEYLVITFQGGLLPLKDRILYFPMASFRFRGSNSSAYGSSSIPLALLPEGNAILYVEKGLCSQAYRARNGMEVLEVQIESFRDLLLIMPVSLTIQDELSSLPRCSGTCPRSMQPRREQLKPPCICKPRERTFVQASCSIR